MKASVTEELAAQKTHGVLLVLTGPSGVGKDSIIDRLLEKDPSIHRIVSTTTRTKRPGEREGNPYAFVSREAFQARVAAGKFLEHVTFRDDLYGTQLETLTDAFATGKDMVWQIEIQGVSRVKERIKHMHPRTVFIFVAPPSLASLRKRILLEEKSEEKMLLRFSEEQTRWQMEHFTLFDYLIVNADDVLDETVDHLRAILDAKRHELLAGKD